MIYLINQEKRNLKSFIILIVFSLILIGCVNEKAETLVSENKSAITIFEGEKHFKNIRQLTFSGENAEAYFSYNADKLIFQSKRDAICNVTRSLPWR